LVCFSALKKEAEGVSETLITAFETVWHHLSEDNLLYHQFIVIVSVE
jgi:hypothetical protein